MRPAVLVQTPQIAEPMDRQLAGVMHTLVGKSLDVSRKVAPRLGVKLMSGCATIDLDRASDCRMVGCGSSAETPTTNLILRSDSSQD